MNKHITHLFFTGATLLIVPFAALADDYSHTEYITVSQPRQQCWNEQVLVNGQNSDGALIGGIAGGLIGNQIGQGNGRVAATAVGAVTGAIVGERLSGNQRPSYRTVQRCNTVYQQVQVPRTVTRVEPRVVYHSIPEVQHVTYVEHYPVRKKHRRHHHHQHYQHHQYGQHHQHQHQHQHQQHQQHQHRQYQD